MNRLRVLITNVTLDGRTGTEMYVRDLSLRLLRRGHLPVVYSTDLGPLAAELRAATVPVLDDLAKLSAAPDVIHGHHHPETLTALLHFPGVPAVYFCHDRLAWHDGPPRFPRILRYIAVDDNCRERFVCEHGIPEARVRVLHNAVDLERFRPRGPLPAKPLRALVFSNNATEGNYPAAVREACVEAGLALDVVGAGVGKSCARPEDLLGQYDLVFAKGRCALEAVAVGTAVVLCDARGVGPLVTTAELDRLRRLNLGMRSLQQPVRPDVLLREINRYDAADATEVARRIRATAGLDDLVDTLLGLYREVSAEQQTHARLDPAAEHAAVAVYLRSLMPFQQLRTARDQTSELTSACDHWRGACTQLRQEVAHWHSGCLALQQDAERRHAEYMRLHAEHGRLTESYAHLQEAYGHLHAAREGMRAELAAVHASATIRLQECLVRLPGVRWLLQAVRRRALPQAH